MPDIYFAIPGNLHTLTGGYGYDRRVIVELEATGFSIHRIHLSRKFPNPDANALADAEAQFKAMPDNSLIIIDGLAFGVMDEIAKRHGDRLNIIALCHHPLALETGLSIEQSKKLQHSEKRALEMATAVIVTSTITAGILTEEFAITPSKITIALPGTDKQEFAECNGDPPVILTVASITKRKAHDVLIDALAQISHLPWRARFVGGIDFDSEWTAFLKRKAENYGLDKRILFIGNVADVKTEYAQADLFVLPSLFEGYGMAFAEALAFGLPIIAARAGAVPSVVPETAGILVEPGNTEALTSALRELLTQHTERKKLQHGAQQAALNLPTWKNTADIIANLINTIKLTSGNIE